MSVELPKKYKHQESEAKWMAAWDEQDIYAWDGQTDRSKVFSVDTPPPTVSGSLHVGHVFSYTQTDVIARYQRMIGKSVFYPMGWDDNGLPTERRVQNVFGITCDPSLPYDPDWKAEKVGKKHKTVPVSRRNFIEACLELTAEDEKAFEALWRRLGLSVDWKLQYATIGKDSQKISQHSFLDMQQKGFVYSMESPTMWDVDFQTAVAQAEIEDKEMPGAYHHLEFGVEEGGSFTIATTRPELLPACIAVVAHPDDERYQSLFGKYAITPMFRCRVPIMASTHADPEKGSGILMVCTFGDAADVDWWRTQDLPIKQVIGQNGRMLDVDFSDPLFGSISPESAQAFYQQIAGLRVKKAQVAIVELLAQAGSGYDGNSVAMSTEPEVISHPVKFYEKGDTPIEFMTTRQWFVKILDHRDQLLEQGNKIKWHPPFMKHRYDSWVSGLNQDWCVSRQRYFGVPFPVWYPVLDNGQADYDSPIYAKKEQLPVDPMSDVPDGFSEADRGKLGGFVGDPDVMDTWATSSLTPQIASSWTEDTKRYESVFPMDIRPQSHEIIRTWAFYTICKALIHEADVPWHHVVVSGWILDPDRKKMSKSKGNVVTPDALLDDYSSDAVRYWASRARLGADTAYDDSVFQIGQKLVTKIFNASKFVVMQLQGLEGHDGHYDLSQITQPVDLAYIEKLKGLLKQVHKDFSAFDYAAALEHIEGAFWMFCDHYIELVKVRAYRAEEMSHRLSALATLQTSLSIFLRLFAPFLPYVTEEVWSWAFSDSGSLIHATTYPTADELASVSAADLGVIDIAVDVMTRIRSEKTAAQKSLKFPVQSLSLSCESEAIKEFANQALPDIILAGVVSDVELTVSASSERNVTVLLAKED